MWVNHLLFYNSTLRVYRHNFLYIACMHSQHFQQSRVGINRVWFPRSAEQKTCFLRSPCSCLRIWPGGTGLAVPSRVSPVIIHTQAVSGIYTRGCSRFLQRRPQICHQPPSGRSRGYQVTRLRTEGVHCRESSGIGPVVPKVVPLTGAD